MVSPDEELIEKLADECDDLCDSAVARIRALIAERDRDTRQIVDLVRQLNKAEADLDEARALLHRAVGVIEWLAPQAGVPIEAIEVVGESRAALKGYAPPQPEIPVRLGPMTAGPMTATEWYLVNARTGEVLAEGKLEDKA